MDSSDIQQKLAAIYAAVEQKRLKDALDGVKELSALQQNWTVAEKIAELSTNYRFMLHYLIEGEKDPEQQHVYDKLTRDIYTLAEDVAENLLRQEDSLLFFEEFRLRPYSMEEFRTLIAGQAEVLSFVDRLKEESQYKARYHREEVQQDLFYAVFTSPRANDDFIASYRKFVEDTAIPQSDKALLIAALTMNILQRFDALKIEFLLDLCSHGECETAIRAITGIIPIVQLYGARLQFYPGCGSRLKLLSDDKTFARRLVAAIIGFIQAHETEKITKRLTEEILPEMMKISIDKKIHLDDWMEYTPDDKNPEWQRLFEESGLTDKLQEFAELQMGGADVFHSTFSSLKSYPFFQEMSNWFLPFTPQHSSVQPLFALPVEQVSLEDSLLWSPVICNSDKYSFCLCLLTMPENYCKMMIAQLGAESEELKKLKEQEGAVQIYQGEDLITNQYIRDLYRFFKLFPRRAEFRDIFELPLNYHSLPAFQPVVTQPEHLEHIALYYFEKNYFAEALSAYTLLAATGNGKSEVWQKAGYCRQMLADMRGALNDYLHADLIEENNTWVLQRIAHCYRMLKEPDSALEYYRRLERFRPNDLNLQLSIGHCFLEMNEYEKALNYYFKVELLDNDNPRAWRSIAWCSFLSRKFDVAEKYYVRILSANPNAHDFLNAGHVALCLGQMQKTVDRYKQSIEKAGSFETFQTMLAEDEKDLPDASLLPVILDKIRYDREAV
jgi:tetratricopeptide (TPR) repeat protein